MSWARFPLFLPDRPQAQQVGWLYLLRAWALGDAPSVRDIMRASGLGAGTCSDLRDEAVGWARAAGAPFPDLTASPLDLVEEWEPPGLLTHADLVQRARAWLLGRHRCSVAFAEIVTMAPVNPDAIGFCTAFYRPHPWSVLVECKVSRADFRADRKKIIHGAPDTCPGQERWYLTPPGLVGAHEVPEGWGLAEAGARSVRVVVPAPEGEWSPGRAKQDMGILVSAVRRHHLGVEWHDEIGKFEAAVVRLEAK